MFIKNYLLSIILLLFLCFAQSEYTSSSTDDYSAVFEWTSDDTMVVTPTTEETSVIDLTDYGDDTTTLEPNAIHLSTVSNSSTSVHSTTTFMSTATDETEDFSAIFESTNPSSDVDSSNTDLTTLQVSISSANTTSTMTNASIGNIQSVLFVYKSIKIFSSFSNKYHCHL